MSLTMDERRVHELVVKMMRAVEDEAMTEVVLACSLLLARHHHGDVRSYRPQSVRAKLVECCQGYGNDEFVIALELVKLAASRDVESSWVQQDHEAAMKGAIDV